MYETGDVEKVDRQVDIVNNIGDLFGQLSSQGTQDTRQDLFISLSSSPSTLGTKYRSTSLRVECWTPNVTVDFTFVRTP